MTVRLSPQDIDRLENKREEQELKEGKAISTYVLQSNWGRHGSGAQRENNWNHRHGPPYLPETELELRQRRRRNLHR